MRLRRVDALTRRRSQKYTDSRPVSVRVRQRMHHSIHYRELARVCRTIAGRAATSANNKALLETADEYQRMADRLEIGRRGH